MDPVHKLRHGPRGLTQAASTRGVMRGFIQAKVSTSPLMNQAHDKIGEVHSRCFKGRQGWQVIKCITKEINNNAAITEFVLLIEGGVSTIGGGLHRSKVLGGGEALVVATRQSGSFTAIIVCRWR